MNTKRTLVVLLAAVVAVSVVGCTEKSSDGPAGTAPQTGGAAATAPAQDGPVTVTVYVPCGLTVPIREAITAFEAANPNITVEATYDTGIVNAKNVRDKGERPDMFVSPGKREIEVLEEVEIVDPADKVAFGYFELIVAVPKENPKEITTIEDLLKADVITMPDPDNNSIGVYGEEALRNAGLWEQLMPEGDERIVLTDKPLTAYEKVANGRSEVALMFENCPMKTYPDKLEEGSVRMASMIDKSLYERPMCVIGLLKESANPAASIKFMNFLIEQETQDIMRDGGLKVVVDLDDYDPTPLAGAPVDTSGADIKVEAYYPGNEGHAYIRDLMDEVAAKYEGKIATEFIDFTSDDGYPRWRAAGMSCGGILVDGEQTLACDRDGEEVDVFFGRGEGGEWTRDDLYGYLDALLAEAE